MMFKDYGKSGTDYAGFTNDLRELADAIDAGTTLPTVIEVSADARADKMTKVQIIMELETGFAPMRCKPAA